MRARAALVGFGPRADNPSKWKKTDFFVSGSGWKYCDSVYNGETAAAALGATDAQTGFDASNATHGCGGQFGHSLLTPYALPIMGVWTTNYGS